MSRPMLVNAGVQLADRLHFFFNEAISIRQANNLCGLFRSLIELAPIQPINERWVVSVHGALSYKGFHVGIFGEHDPTFLIGTLVNNLNCYESTPRELEALAASNQSHGQPAVIH